MKKWHLLSIGMVAVHLGYPLCLLIAKVLDMNYVFYSQLAYEIVVTGLFLTAGIIRSVKKSPATRWDWLLIPVVILNGVCLVASAGLRPLAFMLVNLICAGMFTFRQKPCVRILVIAVYVPIVLFASWWGLIYYVFSEWKYENLLFQAASPSGEYTAQVMSVQTFDVEKEVQVVKNTHYMMLFGEFRHKPQYLQCIPKHETIQVQWLDEHTLIVNGKTYTIE